MTMMVVATDDDGADDEDDGEDGEDDDLPSLSQARLLPWVRGWGSRG